MRVGVYASARGVESGSAGGVRRMQARTPKFPYNLRGSRRAVNSVLDNPFLCAKLQVPG